MLPLIVLISLFLMPSDHDIHVSVTEIVHQDDNKLNVTFKVFFDDLQADMGMVPGENLPAEYAGSDALIEAFIRENIHFYASKAPLELNYTTSYAALPAVWVECEVLLPQRNNLTIELYNSILINRFSDQVNLVKFKGVKKEETFTLNRKNTHISFKI